MHFYNKFYLHSIERGNTLTFQQDNAPAHRSERTRKWFNAKKIPLLQWPPQSPDMNLIESIWNVIGRRINSRNILPASLSELKLIIKEEWERISQKELEDLIKSMPKRLEELRKAKGGQTKF